MLTELAIDRSMRSKDVDGHLFVERTNISKAMVCPYLGKEIPNSEALGLDANKIYHLLRDPQEIERGAPTAAGKPALIIHKASIADNHPRELTVGAIGTDVQFNGTYLTAPLSVWDAEAILGIDTKERVELSMGYRYRADMTPGTYEGQAYDGVMRDIHFNHLALVNVGRCGSDVVVADKLPKEIIMASKKLRLSPVAGIVTGALRAFLAPRLAMDSDIGSVASLVVDVNATNLAALKPEIVSRVTKVCEGKLAKDQTLAGLDLAMDAAEKDAKECAVDADPDDDEDEKKKKEKKDEPKAMDKTAMDAAIATAVAASTATNVAAAITANNALHAAREEVAPLVGKVALDSAEAVYKFALDNAKVDLTDVHPSAYRALVKMLANQPKAAPRIGMDQAGSAVVTELFPNMSRFA